MRKTFGVWGYFVVQAKTEEEATNKVTISVPEFQPQDAIELVHDETEW